MALVDPVLNFATIWPYIHVRPLVYEGNFKNPIMRLLAWVVHALKVPDLDQASAKARSRAEASVQGIIDGLKHGDNFILWPAGRLLRRPGQGTVTCWTGR